MKNQMRVLIGYDGVRSTKNLVQDLKRAGLPKNTKALVLTVVDNFMPPEGNYSDPSLSESSVTYIKSILEPAKTRIRKDLARAKKTAERAAKTIRSSFREWTVQAEACVDSPTWAIVKKEDTWKPDLIVMGSHGGTPMARFFLGSVSRGVLIHSKSSVRIVRHHRRAKTSPFRIILGMDSSADSQKALHMVAERVWPKRTHVRLVTAFDQKMSSTIASHYLVSHAKEGVPYPPTEKARMRQVVEPFANKLKNSGLEVSNVIKAGTPWKILVKEAETWKADCIFVGARGLGAIDRFLLGSVSNAVVSRAHCSVEVVRGK